MSVRVKIVAILVGCLAAVLVTHYAIERLVIQPHFEALEQEEAGRNLQRVEAALWHEVAAIAQGCRDWAAWDETYRYLGDRSAESLRSIAPPSTFRALQLNIVQFYDAQGKLIWGDTRDYRTEECIEIPGLPASGFPADSPLVRHDATGSGVTGLVRLGGGVMLVASFPIVTSEHRGPIRGAVVHGRLFSPEDVAFLRQQACVDVQVTPADADCPPGRDPAVPVRLTRLDHHGRKLLDLIAVLPGIDGRPALQVRVSTPREITAEGQSLLRDALWLIVAAGAITLAVAWLAINHFVGRPLRELIRHVALLRQCGTLSVRTGLKGRDEVGLLAREFDRLVGQLADSRQALARSESRLKSVVQDQTELIYRFTPDGRVTFVNEAFCTYFGRAEKQLLGQHFVPPASAEDLARRILHLRTLKADCPVGEIEFPIQLDHGRRRWLHWTTRAICDSAGNICEFQSVGSDITQRRQGEEELKKTKETAESADRAKSQFLANMSHELRTPLHGILSFAAFGIKQAATAAREELLGYFQKIDRSAKVLLTLVTDLLDLAKLESGKATYELVPLSLFAVANSVADEFSSMVSSRHMKVLCPKPEFDPLVMADQEKIMQVFRNLLSNAIKFSPDGSTIGIEMELRDRMIRVRVIDSGAGIPPAELEAIFDKFIQSSKTRTGAGGTGLGLAICQEIITGHHGRIWAENRPEGGAVLGFELPQAARPASPPDGQGPPESPSASCAPELALVASLNALQAEAEEAARQGAAATNHPIGDPGKWTSAS